MLLTMRSVSLPTMPPPDLQVQVFGSRKNADTRKALRFFAERRVKTHFVDFAERAASLGELRRFSQKFGIEALLDRDSIDLRSWGYVLRYTVKRSGYRSWWTSR